MDGCFLRLVWAKRQTDRHWHDIHTCQMTYSQAVQPGETFVSSSLAQQRAIKFHLRQKFWWFELIHLFWRLPLQRLGGAFTAAVCVHAHGMDEWGSSRDLSHVCSFLCVWPASTPSATLPSPCLRKQGSAPAPMRPWVHEMEAFSPFRCLSGTHSSSLLQTANWTLKRFFLFVSFLHLAIEPP